MHLFTKIKEITRAVMAASIVASALTGASPVSASTNVGTFSHSDTSGVYNKLNSCASGTSSAQYDIIVNGTDSQVKGVRDKYTKKYMPCADYELAVATRVPGKSYYISFVPKGLKLNKSATSTYGSKIKPATVSVIRGASTDTQKVRKIINHIRSKYAYSTAGAFSKSTATLGTFWNTKKGTCWQYSKLFRAMCNYAGMKCQVIYGTANNGASHAWNRVKMDGHWYYADVTWCDYYGSNNTYGPTKTLWSNHKINANSQFGFLRP